MDLILSIIEVLLSAATLVLLLIVWHEYKKEHNKE